MSTPSTTAQGKRWRGLILELLDAGHRNQESRLDNLALWGLMQDLGHMDASRNIVITLCQDLKERGYVTFKQDANKWTGRVDLSQIQITPRGRDLLERTITDPAVHVL